ncbi:hypothetical protein [Mordavella massiliensis]|nr:hypothetical protein [Mordavella massiliensis]
MKKQYKKAVSLEAFIFLIIFLAIFGGLCAGVAANFIFKLVSML